MTLIIALPNKGRLKDPSIKLLETAGIKCDEDDREYACRTNDPLLNVIFVRARDVPSYVFYGAADLGVTGHDIVAESDYEVYELLDLGFGKCKLIVAAPENSGYKSAEELPSGIRVATEFPNLTKKYFEQLGKQAQVVVLHGAVEAAPALKMSDIIVDLTATGRTLGKNRLRVIGVILKSTARLICNRVSYRLKLREVLNFVNRIKGCVEVQA